VFIECLVFSPNTFRASSAGCVLYHFGLIVIDVLILPVVFRYFTISIFYKKKMWPIDPYESVFILYMEHFTVYNIDVFGTTDDFIQYVRTQLNKKGKVENTDYYIKLKYKTENENENDNNKNENNKNLDHSMVGGAANNEKVKNKKTDSTFPFSVVESALNFIDDNVAMLKGEHIENDDYEKRKKSKKDLYNNLKTKTKLQEVQEEATKTEPQETFMSRFFRKSEPEQDPPQQNEISNYLEELIQFNSKKTEKQEPLDPNKQQETINTTGKIDIESIEFGIKEQAPTIQKENHLRVLVKEWLV